MGLWRRIQPWFLERSAKFTFSQIHETSFTPALCGRLSELYSCGQRWAFLHFFFFSGLDVTSAIFCRWKVGKSDHHILLAPLEAVDFPGYSHSKSIGEPEETSWQRCVIVVQGDYLTAVILSFINFIFYLIS